MYLDMSAKWQAIKEHADAGLKSLFPLKGQKRALVLDSVEIKEPEASVDAQRKALVSGGSLTAAVYGNFSLIDLQNQRVINKDKVKILDLPIVTHRGTFVVQGKDYSVFNQTRLRPGVYTSKAEDSDVVSSKFNLGKGLGFRIQLSSDASVFYVVFDASKANTGGQAKIPLYSVLRALGASEGEIKSRWGEKLFNSNVAKSNLMEDVKRIVELTVYQTKRTGNAVEDIRNYFDGTLLNEDTTKVTLGHSYTKVTAEALLDATSKIIRVYNDEDTGDDLDSLLFKEVLSAEDHIFLRISKGARESNGVLAKLRRRLDNVTLERQGPGGKRLTGPAETVRQAMPPNAFSQLVEKFYTTSSLSSPQTEINPIEILEMNHKITAMGEGGISSEHGIPMSARNLHTSHFGFLDPVRTTESTRVGVDLRMTGQSFVKNRNIYSKFIDKNGKEVVLKPVDLNGKIVGFPGQAGHNPVKAMHNGEMVEVPVDKVDYWMEKPGDMFTYTSNLVPFLHNDQGNRVTMASRMVTQAVPLTHREAPLVQIKSERGSYPSYEQELGTKYFSPRAPEDGIVKEVNEKYISVNGKKVDIYSNFPLNYKTFIHMEPKVKAGDKVVKGQILAESNFSDKGTLALGTNLRVAYIPYRGWNHEDGIVISQTAAKKLTSQHMYIKEIELSPDIEVDKRKLAITFPSKITADQMKKLDDDGVAIKGQILERGDFVIAAIAKKEPTTSDALLSKMHLSLANPFKDVSVMWNHDRPGVVTDVLKSNSLIKVILRTEDESRVGDKLCYSPDTEVLTDTGWVAFPDLTMDHTICCLNPATDEIVYNKPTLVDNWEHDGAMYHLETQLLDFMVTPDHQMYIKQRHNNDYSLVKARDIYGKRVSYKKNGCWTGNNIETYTIPTVEHKHGCNPKIVNMNLWLEFLGYYISEGNTDNSSGNYSVVLHQSTSVNKDIYDRMKVVLECLGYNVHEGNNRLIVHNKQLYTELKPLGLCYEKRIPRYALNVSKDQSLILLKALMDGDGYYGNSWIYTSTSKELCDNVQELALKCGLAANVREDKNVKPNERRKWRCFILRSKLTPTVNHGHSHTQKAQTEEYVNYTGKVYCCTVPTHVLYIRRNGKTAWCGNTGRHGNKGTITMILPDNEMPYDKDGKAMDLLLNPAGVISRVNPGQLYDTMAGKIAEKTGKPYLVDNFAKADSSKMVIQQMHDAGITPEEALYDPKTKQELGKVFIGNQYTLKLHKQTEGNFAARATKRYDTNLQPAKGGEEGAKAVGLQDFYALLGHNARHNLREMAVYKSQENKEFWNAIQLGQPIPPAKETFAFEKFKALLGATGVHVQRDDKTYQITPLTDKHVIERSAGELQSGLMLKGNVTSMIPEEGGLFDKRITGGLHGTNWTHVNLAEPVVHPLFRKVVKTLINKDPDDITGHEAHAALSGINVDARLAELREELKRVKGTSRDKVIKQIKYLSALQKMNMHPKDYVLTKFPIIPPQYRPIYASPTGGAPMVSDLNNLYRDLINTNEALHELREFPDEDKVELRKSLNQAAGAVIGVTDPINVKSKKQDAKGAMQIITGTTAKDGFFHRKIMYRTQDSTGRGTILPNPNLHVDEAEIPKDMAFQLFKPFIVNNMVKKGIPTVDALKHVADQTHASEIALKEEMEKRPIILNRAPTLHKYNMMAFKPKAIEGKSIFIPPLIIKGYNADFDGDSVSGDTWVLIQNEKGNKIQLKQIRDVE